MSLPTITNNSPVLGSIAWTAFGITYNGVSYSIPADNSAMKFVWWVYNAGAPYLAESDTFPTLAQDDLLLFLNKGGIGLLVPTADVTDGGLVVPGSIYAAAIAADQIQTNHLQSNAVISTKIAANAITANALAANSIYGSHVTAGALTVDKLTSGSIGDDLITNGSFEDGALGWTVNTQTNGVISIATGVASSGKNSLEMNATSTTADLRLRQDAAMYIPVSSASARRWYIAARMGTLAATTVGTYIRAHWYDGNKTYISFNDVLTNSAMTTTFSVYEGQVTPPSTARYMAIEIIFVNPNVATKLYVDEVIAREVVVAAVIGDGQITTPKIVANAITANLIASSAVTARAMLIADLTNLWENPDFEADTVGQQPLGIEANTNCSVISGGADGSGKALQVNALNGSANNVYATKIIPVVPGDKYFVRHSRKFLNTIGTASAGIGFRTYTAAKVISTTTLVDSTTTRPTTWGTTAGAVYTVPAGVYFIQPMVSFSNNAETTNRLHVDNIILRRMNGGELLIDGAVTAEKIAANAITSNAISSNAIDGKTITGATIIGGEIRTTEQTGSIAARMGPTSVFDPFGGTTRAGIGFSVAGNTQDPAGMYSPAGTDLMITQGGAANAGSLAYASLGNNNAKLYGWNTATVTGRSGVTIDSQVGPLDLKGNQILVNGQDLSAGEVQAWNLSGSIGDGVIPVIKLGGATYDANTSTSSALATFSTSTNLWTISNTGVYDIHVNYGQSGGATGGRNFVEIGASNQDRLLSRSVFGATEDSVSVVATGVRLAAGDTVRVEALQYGPTRTYVGRMRLKRVAAPVPVTAWQNGSQSLTGDLTVSGNTSIKHRRAEFNNGGFAVAANAIWDIGPQTLGGAPGTLNNDFCEPGPYAGSIGFTKSGYYAFTAFVLPQGNPGGTWLRAQRGGDGRFLGQTSNGAAWENTLTLVPFYVAAGDYVRFAYSASIAHNIQSWVTVTQPY